MSIHEPDEMGFHSDDGIVWLQRSKYPNRQDARKWYLAFTKADFLDVRILSRHARHAPELPEAAEFDGEYWIECEKDEPGAFPVWRCE